MSEIPQPPQRDLTPEQADAAEALVDKRGISFDMAERAILGTRIETSEPEHVSHTIPKLHPTGHVRDFEGDRDYQLAAEREDYQPLPKEQPEINARGRAKVEEALDDAFGKDRKIKAIESEVERQIPIDPDNQVKSLKDRETLLNALLRKHFDRSDS